MPQESQLSHKNIRHFNIPYVSNLSPTATDPSFVTGSQEWMTSINGYAERRLGFADSVEPTPTVFHNLQRTFTWDNTDARFFVMFCDINSSSQAQVFKMEVGKDSQAVLIFTDTGQGAGPTGTVTPFDFVVS